MKSQQTQKNSQLIFQQSIINLQDKIQKEIPCSQNKISTQACLNKKCQAYAFMCKDQNCQCQKPHINCYAITTKRIKKGIKSKGISLQPLENLISQKIERIIDQLSNLRQNILKHFKQQFQYFGLTKNQLIFAQTINNGTVENITGKNIWQLIYNFENQQKQAAIQMEINEVQSNLDENFNKLNQQIKTNQAKLYQQINKLKKHRHFANKSNQNLHFANSAVIEVDKINDLGEFFQKKKIQQTKLLYRASENNFQISKFHQKCSNIANTLTVCKTQFEKVVGGFTPLHWFKPQNGYHVKDDMGQTFIFSLTNKDKFVLKNKEKAIFRYSNCTYGPSFGNSNDFEIVTNSNEKQSSCSDLNQSYFNANYVYNSGQSLQKFCGSSDGSFKIKEWEVWEIQFSQ